MVPCTFAGGVRKGPGCRVQSARQPIRKNPVCSTTHPACCIGCFAIPIVYCPFTGWPDLFEEGLGFLGRHLVPPNHISHLKIGAPSSSGTMIFRVFDLQGFCGDGERCIASRRFHPVSLPQPAGCSAIGSSRERRKSIRAGDDRPLGPIRACTFAKMPREPLSLALCMRLPANRSLMRSVATPWKPKRHLSRLHHPA